MSLSIGIVGLPNAGKSTLFNALVARRLSPTAAYPFTTIEPHEAVVPVPDENLAKLSDLIKPEKTTPATVTFIDIAGLVKGASQGEGLGNQFLGKIREVDAIVHVVRAYLDDRVPHSGGVSPAEDIQIVNTELELGGITGKPTLYVINVSEDQLALSENFIKAVTPVTGADPVIVVAAKLEEELSDLAVAERDQYRRSVGFSRSGLDQVITQAYTLLRLITFYTIKGGREVRAWSLRAGESALSAARGVHTDFSGHFIVAEVISIDELLAMESWHAAKEHGALRFEGRDYVIHDRDVVEFKVGT